MTTSSIVVPLKIVRGVMQAFFQYSPKASVLLSPFYIRFARGNKKFERKERKTDKIQVGMVGVGFVAHIHINAFKENSLLARVVGICASKKGGKRVEEFAEIYGIPKVYENFEEMAASPDIDVIDGCVPTGIHEDVIIAAARNKKHIICEKPLTGYFGENQKDKEWTGETVSKRHMLRKVLAKTQRITEVIAENNVKFMYAENFVYAPAVDKAKRLIKASGAPIMELRAEESHSGSHAAYARCWKTAGGGSLLRMGSHPVGVVLHLKRFEGQIKYGKPIRAKSVFAEIGHLTKMKHIQDEKEHYIFTGWGDVEDWSVVVISFEDDSKATIFSTDVSLGGVKNLVEIYTSQGVIYANITPNNMMMAYAPTPHIWGDEYISEKLETKAGWSFPSPDEDWARGYPQEIRDFMKALLENKEPISGLVLAKETTEIIYAAYVSAEEGIRIELVDIFNNI